MPLSGGAIFAGFTIVRLLGSGGMGEVYLAEHPRLPRRDALKVLPADVSADPDYRARFNREADLASKLWHPHIVSVHDRGEYNGQLWISMDFVDGLDAARLLADRYPVGMPVDQVLRIVTAVASALDYAHKRGLLHRDVKPANIMLTHVDEDEQRILLADFGIARTVGDISGLTTTNMTVGTVAYAAPEQLMGEEIDGRADEYALAATAYHLLTASQLFPHSNPAVVISRHLNAAPPRLRDHRPDLGDLDAALSKALSKNPDDRFETCSDFALALAGHTHGGPASKATAAAATQSAPVSSPTGAAESTEGEPRKQRLVRPAIIFATALVLMLIGALVFVGVQLAHNRQSATPPTTAPLPASPTTVLPPQPQIPTTTTMSTTTTTTTAPTTSTASATVDQPCSQSDDDKLAYDPAAGEEVFCMQSPLPYGWFWKTVPPMTGVHTTGTSCEGQKAYSYSRSTDGYLIECVPTDLGNPEVAPPGSTWHHASNI